MSNLPVCLSRPVSPPGWRFGLVLVGTPPLSPPLTCFASPVRGEVGPVGRQAGEGQNTDRIRSMSIIEGIPQRQRAVEDDRQTWSSELLSLFRIIFHRWISSFLSLCTSSRKGCSGLEKNKNSCHYFTRNARRRGETRRTAFVLLTCGCCWSCWWSQTCLSGLHCAPSQSRPPPGGLASDGKTTCEGTS